MHGLLIGGAIAIMSPSQNNGSSIRDIANHALSLGISVVPPAEDGTKRPGTGGWKRFQTERASIEQIITWYGPRTGVGFVCGGISGGLELFEFDDRATYLQYKEAAIGLGGGQLIDRIEGGYLEETPGGGIHWFYYASELRGSAKLAVRRTEGDNGSIVTKTLIETKGEGGFVIVAPTFGAVHPSGKPYRAVRGEIATIAGISDEERDWLWELAKSFDRSAADPPQVSNDEAHHAKRTVGGWDDTVSPGDDFVQRTKWADILAGWTLAYRHGQTEYWRRPDKNTGHSATVNHTGTDHLHVFTSSSAFEPNVSYSRFAAYAKLEHRGDFKRAAKALYDRGFGTHKRWVREDHKWILRVFQNPCPKGHRIAKQGDGPPDDAPTQAVAKPSRAVDPLDLDDEFGSLTDEELGLVSADSIEPEPIRWEWANRVAKGKLNLVAGEGGDGKSQIAIAVIAAITSGGKFPDGSGPALPGTCFILAAEDGARDTIVPRLIAAGADRSKVKINNAKVTFKDKAGKAIIHPVSFQDLPYWRVALTRHKVRVLVADPLPAYLGRGVNDHRNNEVRAVLEPFVDLLDELGVALIAITHLNKSTDQKTPTHKILGSVAYSNLARTVHCTYRDPEDAERRFYCMVKANIVAPQPTLAFRIEPHEFVSGEQVIKTARVKFEDAPVNWSPAAHMNGQKQQGSPGPASTKAIRVAEFIYDVLFGNGWLPLGKIIDDAGTMDLLGEQNHDGKWSCVNNIYRGQEKVASLPPPKDGFQVVVQKMPFRGYGKETTHWKLDPLEDVPF